MKLIRVRFPGAALGARDTKVIEHDHQIGIRFVIWDVGKTDSGTGWL